jgi:hypothetical protein
MIQPADPLHKGLTSLSNTELVREANMVPGASPSDAMHGRPPGEAARLSLGILAARDAADQKHQQSQAQPPGSTVLDQITMGQQRGLGGMQPDMTAPPMGVDQLGMMQGDPLRAEVPAVPAPMPPMPPAPMPAPMPRPRPEREMAARSAVPAGGLPVDMPRRGMRGGGVVNLPTDMRYSGGGIVGYANGGDVMGPPEDRAASSRARLAAFRQLMSESARQRENRARAAMEIAEQQGREVPNLVPRPGKPWQADPRLMQFGDNQPGSLFDQPDIVEGAVEPMFPSPEWDALYGDPGYDPETGLASEGGELSRRSPISFERMAEILRKPADWVGRTDLGDTIEEFGAELGDWDTRSSSRAVERQAINEARRKGGPELEKNPHWLEGAYQRLADKEAERRGVKPGDVNPISKLRDADPIMERILSRIPEDATVPQKVSSFLGNAIEEGGIELGLTEKESEQVRQFVKEWGPEVALGVFAAPKVLGLGYKIGKATLGKILGSKAMLLLGGYVGLDWARGGRGDEGPWVTQLYNAAEDQAGDLKKRRENRDGRPPAEFTPGDPADTGGQDGDRDGQRGDGGGQRGDGGGRGQASDGEGGNVNLPGGDRLTPNMLRRLVALINSKHGAGTTDMPDLRRMLTRTALNWGAGRNLAESALLAFEQSLQEGTAARTAAADAMQKGLDREANILIAEISNDPKVEWAKLAQKTRDDLQTQMYNDPYFKYRERYAAEVKSLDQRGALSKVLNVLSFDTFGRPKGVSDADHERITTKLWNSYRRAYAMGGSEDGTPARGARVLPNR